MNTRNQIASHRKPDVRGPPGFFGKNSPFQGSFDLHAARVKQRITKKSHKKQNKNKTYKKKTQNINSEDLPYPSKKESLRSIRVVHLNVEGLTRAKSEILSKTFKDADVLALQETYVPEGESSRLKIPGFNMIDYIGHRKHGLATYVNQNIEETNVVPIAGNIHSIGIRIGNLITYNVYKPPSEMWSNSVLPVQQYPTIYIGDFNSHSTEWGYPNENEDWGKLTSWAAVNRLLLVYDAKQVGTFESGRWGTTTSPDLCFVSIDKNHQPIRVSRAILQNFQKANINQLL
jgi:hypothetical protein